MIQMSKPLEIGYQDVDYTGNLRLSRLFDIFSNIATIHATKIGVWNDEMMQKYGWIVSKMHLEILKPITPDIYELGTFTGLPSKVIFPRYYYLKQNDDMLVKASSIWTLLDLKNRRITLPKRAGIEFPQDEDDVSSFCKLPDDIPQELNYQLVEVRQVKFSDVDTNQHMNNARYIEWACDILPYELFRSYYISEVDIYFKHEIAPLSKVELYLAKENELYFVQGVVQGEICFEIKNKIKKINESANK
ncbi:MAG: acyl-[acyl-carrier-protein] thioesterase [Beduini sp.]